MASNKDYDTDASADVSVSVWKRWRTNKLVPRLTPQNHRRRRRNLNDESASTQSSMGHLSPLAMIPIPQEDRQSALLSPPDSPPRSLIESSNNNNFSDNANCNTPIVQDNSISLEQQTPPAFSPLPDMVSAKRLGKEVRRNHSKRRRSRCDNDSDKENAEWTSPDDEGEYWRHFGQLMIGLSPEERTKQYWKLCYGTQPSQPEDSFSANRAPPVKSWYALCTGFYFVYLLTQLMNGRPYLY